ncbi:CBS domain-containing protein [Algihabitans albus]|uniref:CBS domain-containing protein n=1 Tax=Algihabitans albus TaxID=2164067 RepID=UPI000E5D885C|nr:CBS domain-containing protein [Algihabitans albus]
MNRRIMPDVIAPGQQLSMLSPDATVTEAVRLMRDRHIGAVLILEGQKLRGIFTERDVLTRVVAQERDPATTPVSDVMTPDPDTVAPDDTAIDALDRMSTQGYRHLPVVASERVVAIVSIRDLYAAVRRSLERDLRERDAYIFGESYGTS